MKTKLAILTGGSSMEKEISYKSCQNLICFLNCDKYKVKVIEVSNDINNLHWIEELTLFSPDIVFSTLHGGAGENGSIQGFLNTLNIKYVGSKVLSSSICIDKQMTKKIMQASFIPVVDGIFLPYDSNVLEYKERINELGFPLILKPNKGGGSIGISIVENFDQLLIAVELIKKLKDDILIEKFIKGNEVTCCIIEKDNGLEVLPILDISSNLESEFFDYKHKYMDTTENISFSTLPMFLQTMIQEIAKKVFLALNCIGYANVDFIIKEEQVYLLEVNTLPGLTRTSLLPKAVEGTGLGFGEFLDQLITFELKREEYK